MLTQRLYTTLLIGLLGGFSIFISVAGALLGISIIAYLVAYLLLLLLLPLILRRNYVFRFSWCRISICLFFIYALCSTEYSISTIASKEKLVNILYSIVSPLLLIEFVSGFFYNFPQRMILVESDIIKISKYLLVSSFCLFVLGFTVDYGSGRYGLIGMINPIWACRMFACLTLWISYEYFYLKRKSLFSLLLIVAGVYLVYKTGSNGPLLVLFLCHLILFKDHLDWKKILLIIIFGMLVAIFFFFGERGAEASMFSFLSRLDMIDFVFQFNPEHMWKGAGIGSFGLLYFNVDEVAYPHNIFLEIYIEWGIIGISLFIFILFSAFRRFTLNYITIATIFYFINSLFSGDVVGNNVLFIFLYLSSFFCHKVKTAF